jgi:hypothetical protein
MTASSTNRDLFFETLRGALANGTFRKATLSKSNAGYPWRRVVVSLFTDSKGGVKASFEASDGTRVERRNLAVESIFDEISLLLPERLRAINMRLTDQEISFEQMESGAYRLKRRLLEEQQADQPLESHNRAKNYAVPSDSSFLVELGISSRSGDVKPDRYDKFRQLQKFVEIITDLIPESARSSTESLAVVDFGSGKHYLTFALHHILSQTLGDLKVTGVERREDLVLAGRSVANKLGLKSLEFINSSISQAELRGVDLVVALHACDTATDDAIARAIKADANYICVAPCCHQYVRQRMTPSTDLDALLRHGIILERFAEGLTDSLRVLALESHGYKTKLFEFISPEHTAKNVMITAVKTGRANQESAKTMQALKTKFDLKDFYLDTVLAKS